MNSNTRKHCPQENSAGQSPFPAPKHGTSLTKERDTVDKLFPNKPVFHKRLANPTSYVQGSIQINNTSSRPPARELHMNRVIQEKQLMLQKKLWKVEDALRQKNLQDNVGIKDGQANMKHKNYELLVENVESTNPRHKTELTGNEMLYQGGEKNCQQNKFRQDTVKMHNEETTQDKKPTENNAMEMWKEESRKTNVNIEKTGPKVQQKTRPRLTTRDMERVVPEKPVQPQCSQTLKLELANNTDKNDQRLPCKICNRKFNCDRLEKHERICEKVKNSGRPVFNSHMQRTKGKNKTPGTEPLR